MNADTADTADTRFPHLDLEDLIAEVTGQPIGDRAKAHLAGCEHCQLEAKRWNLVARGVSGLAASVPETAGRETAPPVLPPTLDPFATHTSPTSPTPSAVPALLVPPAPTLRPGRRLLASPRRRATLATAAAAALVLGGGLTVALSSHAPGTGADATTALTTVNGCAQLEQAAGTLERVNGGSVVIKTASGQPVTVTTTATTTLNAAGALLNDITDGARVLVAGTRSGAVISADLVAVGGNPSLAIPGVVVASGTVADAGAAGFTVVTPAGTRTPVTTSGGTDVTVFNASPGQLQAGASTIAIGHPGPDGTLSALAVLQPPTWPRGARTTVTVKDCSPASINRTITALASAL
jgi:hypothetical protein